MLIYLFFEVGGFSSSQTVDIARPGILGLRKKPYPKSSSRHDHDDSYRLTHGDDWGICILGWNQIGFENFEIQHHDMASLGNRLGIELVNS